MSARSGLRYSLTALRAFEAVSRSNNLSAAARELGVSPAAVSFQIRELQARLGAPLIRRSSHGVTLTEQGAMLAGDLSRAFAGIDEALTAFERRAAEMHVVTISMLPSFASRWFIPRLARLLSEQPALDVRLSTTERRVDLLREGFDFAVRAGEGPWEGLTAERLFEQRLAPVCHRSYAAAHAAAVERQDWAGLTVIGARSRADAWRDWARLAGSDAQAARPKQSFDTSEHVMQAIFQGVGVGLADIPLVEADLRSGELVQVASTTLETGWSHFLVHPEGRPLSPAAAAFRAWTLAEAEGSGSTP